MRAIVLSAHGGTDNFRLAELPIPPLRPGDVRIRVRSVAFNPVDAQIRRGGPEGRMVRSPILGRDLSGIVEAVDDAADFQPGDEVYSYVCNLASSGTYAESVSVPAELVARKPRTLSHDQAAAVPVAGITATLALRQAQAEASRSLFVAGGAGGVGTFALMLARHLGVTRLVTTAGYAGSRAYLIERCGLADDQIVDYRQDDFTDRAKDRNGGPFDSVLDLVGGTMLSACCKLLALEGHLASVTETPALGDADVLFQRNASFHTVGANAYSLVEDRAVWRRYRDMLDQLAALFDGGALPPPPITNLGPLSVETVRQAHELLERGAVQGKLVMSCP
ncbi:quinone oxidoreductase family protein [Inquilinus sp. CA228]|uniref:quinone oxidoreductase family protein n=1 Tax=Inquilinus sp. CA228 TaxID=3455609 RepID=UPI003F8D5999